MTVHQEKVSDDVTDRAALKRAIASIQGGDVPPVTRLDRLARITRDLLTSSTPSGTKASASGPFGIRGPTLRRRTAG